MITIKKNKNIIRAKKYYIYLTMLSVKTQLVLFTILTFIIIGSPAMYKLTNDLIGKKLNTPFVTMLGVPTSTGLFVHSIVFGLLTYIYLRTFSV